jgi:hypothetical protein
MPMFIVVSSFPRRVPTFSCSEHRFPWFIGSGGQGYDRRFASTAR